MLAIILVAAYLLFNLIALTAFWADKKRSENGKYRIPERKLIAIAAVGAFGATAAMLRYRHKTKKTLFKLVYLFAALHVAAIAFLAHQSFMS